MNKKQSPIILVLSILAVVLIIAQLAVMCMPYINLLPIKVRERQDPARDFSLQQFCWTETETMTKIFTQQIATGSGFDRVTTPGPHYIKGFKVNDFVIDLVLVNLFGVVALIFLIVAIKNHLAKYTLGGASFVKFAAGFCSILWAGWSLYTFSSGLFLWLGQLGNANAVYDHVPMICLCIAGVGLVISLAYAVLLFVHRTRYKVAKPSTVQ